VLGIRRSLAGDINRTEERKRIPKRLNNPKYNTNGQDPSANDYSINCFGDEGRLMQYLPNSYNKDGKLELQNYDICYDLPQMLEAVLRQLNDSQGIQYGSQIRIPLDDGQVLAYPTQIAMLTDLAKQVNQLSEQQQKILLLSIATDNEVKELFAGIGIPVVTKFIAVSANGESKQLPYIGYQKGKPSILEQIATVKITVATTLGQLLPRKDKSGWNPFVKKQEK
jgi:hypothetical protein